jgi:festuclavine dehydrogenase
VVFFTASGDGKIPFIACDDIAAVAFCALTSKRSLNADVLLLGPDLLSYDDVSYSFQ